MVELLEVSEREMAAENLIMSKGYSDVAVTMTDGYVDVIIVSDELNFSARAQIEDIVKRKMQVEADKITINAISVDDID
jgi:stage III sporulation protein AH